MASRSVIPLTQLHPGEAARIRCFLGDARFVSRLATKGLFVGFALTIVDSGVDGRRIEVSDTTLVLERADCENILVERLEAASDALEARKSFG